MKRLSQKVNEELEDQELGRLMDIEIAKKGPKMSLKECLEKLRSEWK